MQVEVTPLVGTVVVSKSGRDRKRVFVVIGVEGTPENMRLAVTDGRLRRTERPKLKNPRHVRLLARLTEDESSRLKSDMTDETVREILASYDRKVR